MCAKNRFIGVRLEPEQVDKLVLLSFKAEQPGNLSAGLRWALNQVKVTGTVDAEVSLRAENQEEVFHI